MTHCEGMKLVASEPAIITNRSSHIPTFTNSDSTQTSFRLWRTRGENNASGITQLHATMIQNRNPWGPK